MTLTVGIKYDVDSLNFTGWTTTGGETAHDGYSAYDYFDQAGKYLGADEFGIEPTAELHA